MDATQRLTKKLPPSLRKRLGDLRRAARVLPARTARQKRRLLADASLTSPQRELLRGASSRIFYNDLMYLGNGEHYFRVGLSAITCIDEAIKSAGLREVRSVLDLPSGAGRVLRFLVRRFPGAEFAACDLQRDAVDFCARAFGARPFYSTPDFKDLSLGRSFDLVWCGSLVTHLDRADIEALLDFFKRHLAPGSLLVFTTMGDYVVRRLPSKVSAYGVTDAQVPAVTEEYAQSGFGFAPYPLGACPVSERCGATLTSPAWIRAQVRRAGGLGEVYFAERGWDRHQDVFGFVRE